MTPQSAQKLKNHTQLNGHLMAADRFYHAGNMNGTLNEVGQCIAYIIEQIGKGAPGFYKEMDLGQRVRFLDNADRLPASYLDVYEGYLRLRQNGCDNGSMRRMIGQLLGMVEAFLEDFPYPSFKDFYPSPGAPRNPADEFDVTPVLLYSNNHPELVRLHSRVDTHIQNQFYEDAATNLRLELEYILLQYVKEFVPELYPESISTKITELHNRGYISDEIEDWMHRIRKMGNKEGAHYNEEPVDVEELKVCFYNMERVEAEFLRRFPHPSQKPIPQEYLHQQAKGPTTHRPGGMPRPGGGYSNGGRPTAGPYGQNGVPLKIRADYYNSPEGQRELAEAQRRRAEAAAKSRARQMQEAKKYLKTRIIILVALVVLTVVLIVLLRSWSLLFVPVLGFPALGLFILAISSVWDARKKIKELEETEKQFEKGKRK